MAFAVLVLMFAFAAPGTAQTRAQEAGEEAEATLSNAEIPASEVAAGFESGIGRLMLEGRESSMAYTLTLTGDMFPLQALAVRMGGEVIVGP